MLRGSSDDVTVAIPMLAALLAGLTVSLVNSRADAHHDAQRRNWQLATHCLLGLGIWTTHCAGLLLSTAEADEGLVHHFLFNGLALLICVLVSVVALGARRTADTDWLSTYVRPSGMGLGLTIALLLTLQATGFSLNFSMRGMTVLLAINLLASFVICNALLASRRPWSQSSAQQLGMACLLALAVATLHYGSMMTVVPTPRLAPFTLREVLSTQWLDTLANLAALAVLSGALVSALLDARRSHETSNLLHSLTAANRELSKLAYHDPLTLLPNQGLFIEKLRLAIERAQRQASPLFILLLDLDGYKAVNKAFGHHQGDRLLAHVASQIRSAVPRRHPVARIGGDEFAVLLDLGSPEDIIHLGSHVLNLISMPYQIDGHALSVTASLGIAQYPQDGTTPRALIEHATMAMYYAKNGQQAYAFFEPTMNALARDHLLLLSDLRQAVSQQQLVLHYQPIIRAPDGPMVAAEVLIRWHHPRRGLLLPETFIGQAERAGLIVDIGNWVIDAACRQLRQWTDQGHTAMRLAINVSAIQLHYELLVDTLQMAVQRHAIAPSRLTLEFTESAALKDPERSLVILQRLQALGFRISLDDFGTGYSSLLYLKQLPATELKIDRSFVSEIDKLDHDRTIVAAIIALARQLHMSIVAEGVETLAQKQLLCELGCTYLQGYLLGAPVPADELPGLSEQALVG
ncbi:putative bifunctional diguanylate cyclase/phosphodiesterase [Frateuria aurantia]